jgi:hypothetical protein
VDRAEREIRTKTTKDELLRRKADLLERKAALGTPGHVGWRAEVEVEPREEATFVELHATTRSAQWMPVYDVRVETAASGEETLVLDAFALLKNATGEDWRDVVLVVTTVRPKLSEPLPELRRMVVSARAGAASQSLAIGASGGRTLHTGIDPSGSEEDQIEHTAPGKVDVPASGNPARIRLFGATLPADTRLEIAPLETTVGSWVASAANTSGKVLLPGLVRVFRGRSYAGRSQIGFVVPGQRFRLAIGHDAACRVERKVIRSAREEKLTGGCVERFSNRTSIENPGASRLRLLLRDRVPVSRTSDVTVKIVEQPSGLSIEEESGLTALEIDLAPRERKLLETVWTVKTPAELTLPVPERL